MYKQRYTIVFLLSLVLSFSCKNKLYHFDIIGKELGMEAIDGDYLFVVDTCIAIGEHTVYGISTWENMYTHCFVFDERDSLVENLDFPQNMNKIMYRFRQVGEGDEPPFLVTYFLGGGTHSNSLSAWGLDFSEKAKVVWNGLVFEEKTDSLNAPIAMNSFEFNVSDAGQLKVDTLSHNPRDTEWVAPFLLGVVSSE